MILTNYRVLLIRYNLFIVFFFFINTLSGQNNNPEGLSLFPKKFNLRQDTTIELKKRDVLSAEPDTNFTWEKYAKFLNKVSDTSKYIVLPINEFRQTFNSKKIVIGLRHDVDNDLNVAYKFSEVESKLGFRSTYFILHTAPYYLSNSNNMSVHTEKIIPILKTMQDEKHFEIGWHNDLVTLQVIYNINPVTFLHNELNWLRSNGINIVGTASHGSNYCKAYHYLNYYFFEECTLPVVPNFVNNITVPVGEKNIALIKGKLNDFGLQYEAYFLNNNKAFSDATITYGIRWNIGMLDLDQLQTGDRVIILLHPIHWHKASEYADFESFSLSGQKSSSIDFINSKISVLMPHGTDKNSLVAVYSLSPGAYAKVTGKLQVSKSTFNNFNNPLTYTVYAENRDIKREWIIDVHNAKNSECDFLSFAIPGLTKSVLIDTINNTVNVEINAGTSKDSLRPSFLLSENSRAWIGKQEQISEVNFVNFSNPVVYSIVSKDSQIIKKWRVTILQTTHPLKSVKPTQAGLLIYPNPSAGNICLQFIGIQTSPTTVNIYNTQGEKVFTEMTKKTGNFTLEADLKKLTGGVYIVRYSEAEKPEIIVIEETLSKKFYFLFLKVIQYFIYKFSLSFLLYINHEKTLLFSYTSFDKFICYFSSG